MARRELDIDTNDNIHRHLFMGNICKKLVFFWKFLEVMLILPIFLWDLNLQTSCLGLSHEIEKKWEKYNLHINMSEFEFLSRNSSQTSIYWRRSKISAYRRYLQNFLSSFQKIREKKIYPSILFYRVFRKIFKNWYNLVNFLNFKMNFHTHRWVVLIFFEMLTYLIYLLYHI